MAATSKRKIAFYLRLSREDGDKTESNSITNQRIRLISYIRSHPEFADYEIQNYIDDGYSGTNFDRPGYKHLINDIEDDKICIVIVKDLSRLGRNMPKVTEIVQDYFPGKKVRFIAIDDNIDKQYCEFDASGDMMLDIKNMFNGFYPRDISKKVRSTLRTKQSAGQFIGAFACYGYKKDPADHNQLLIDEPAAKIVKRIYHLYLSGKGQNTIAKLLNEENIPCPSAYKKLCGLNYQNCKRLDSTTYWTYSSIRNILRNRIYTGCMVQNTSFRQVCQKKAVQLPEDKWIVVENTHEPVIDKDTFERVQKLLGNHTRQTDLQQNIHIFAGLLRCGNCGRAMVKIKRSGITTFTCGTYHRYGKKYCSAHNIPASAIEEIVKTDLNTIITSMDITREILDVETRQQAKAEKNAPAEIARLKKELEKLSYKKSRVYDDYSEDLISKEEFIQYKKRYDILAGKIKKEITTLSADAADIPARSQWIIQLLENGSVSELDRETVVEMVHMIYIFADNRIQIIYNFSDQPEGLICASTLSHSEANTPE